MYTIYVILLLAVSMLFIFLSIRLCVDVRKIRHQVAPFDYDNACRTAALYEAGGLGEEAIRWHRIAIGLLRQSVAGDSPESYRKTIMTKVMHHEDKIKQLTQKCSQDSTIS